eukprot:6910230-Prorocentrum_lima.AAC.1
MTSSLVGSEMCIRDRRKKADRQQTASLPCGEVQPAAPLLRFRHMGQRAVSYTHLTLPTICSV